MSEVNATDGIASEVDNTDEVIETAVGPDVSVSFPFIKEKMFLSSIDGDPAGTAKTVFKIRITFNSFEELVEHASKDTVRIIQQKSARKGTFPSDRVVDVNANGQSKKIVSVQDASESIDAVIARGDAVEIAKLIAKMQLAAQGRSMQAAAELSADEPKTIAVLQNKKNY